MTVRDQVSKLEALLQRVRANAAKPRARLVAESSIAAPSPIVTVDDAGIEDLEELDDDFVELVAGGSVQDGPVELDFDDSDETRLQSSPRAAASLGEALDEIAQSARPEEPAPRTPPPESGNQDVESFSGRGSVQISGADDVDDLLEADISDPASTAPRPRMPTMEQLGETVELEGADEPDANLELDEPLTASSSASTSDALEVSLPGPAIHGAYDAGLEAPPSARAALKSRQDAARPVAPVLGAVSGPAASPPQVPDAPDVVARPVVSATARPAEIIQPKRASMSETFAGLLDQSLTLGR